ncbi:MAG: GNAT family N-acetyltransferase, partial [Phenylobacterium sp.]
MVWGVGHAAIFTRIKRDVNLTRIKIWTALPRERDALVELQRRASLVWADQREALLAHPEAIDLPAEQLERGQVMAAEADGATLGFSVVLPRDDGGAELDGLFVEPDAWGRGVGRRLVDAAAKSAREAGAGWLHVIGNPNAVGFYEACGFERAGEAQTRFGPAILMRLGLVIPQRARHPLVSVSAATRGGRCCRISSPQ